MDISDRINTLLREMDKYSSSDSLSHLQQAVISKSVGSIREAMRYRCVIDDQVEDLIGDTVTYSGVVIDIRKIDNKYVIDDHRNGPVQTIVGTSKQDVLYKWMKFVDMVEGA